MSKLILPQHITSVDEAKAFFTHLHEIGMDFHPDDSAASIENVNTGRRLFTDEEAPKIDALMAEVFALEGFDVYAFTMELDGHVMED